MLFDRMPLDGDNFITSPFGAWEPWRKERGWGPHKGVDLRASSGTPIKAPAAGVVNFVSVFVDQVNGIWVGLTHPDGSQSMYLHMSKRRDDLKVGDMVRPGDILGWVGATGAVTGPHLHWAYRLAPDTEAVDPMLYRRSPLTTRLSLAAKLLTGRSLVYPDAIDPQGRPHYDVVVLP